MANEQLWRGEQLCSVRIKTFAVLCYLLDHHERLVRRDELLTAVWPEVVVSDSVLTECIYELRSVLGDDAKTPQYIETVHRRGYQFIGKVVRSAVLSRSLFAPSSSFLPPPDKPSIAVLPFTNLSGDPKQEYFSDGITENVITDLSKFSGLFVIARNSTFTYKGQAVNVKEVGREFGVRYVLEGSTQKAADRVRVTAQLVEAATSHHLWAERYDRELTELFALQDEITQQIVVALRVEVREAELARVRRIPTENLTAYDAWLRGWEYYWRFTKEDNAQARQWFERAIELDPQYADAYASLGRTYWLEWLWWKNQDPPLLERAGELAQQALALDDSLPNVHMLLGYIYLWQKQPEQAIAEGERALALDPNNADAYYRLAEILNLTGRPAEALGLVQQAMRLNPHYPAGYPFNLGLAYRLTGQYAEAIAALQNAHRRNPNFLSAYPNLAWSYVNQWAGQRSEDPQTLERAVEAAQQAVARSDSTFWAHGTLSVAYLWQKRHEEALVEAERSVALNATDALSHTFVGDVLNFAGRPEEALERMEQVNCSTALVRPAYCFNVLGEAYYLTRRYEEAIGTFHQGLMHKPDWIRRLFSHLELAARYSELGREEEARMFQSKDLPSFPVTFISLQRPPSPIVGVG